MAQTQKCPSEECQWPTEWMAKPAKVDATVNTDDTGPLRSFRWKCCFCFRTNVKNVTVLVAMVSLFFIVSNLLAKIGGYSEIGWNYELLFLIVDGIAILSMFYGLYSENAAFLQPFIVLNIITVSLLILLAAYLSTAMVDASSFASQELELELNKRLSDAAKKMQLEFKLLVSLVATLAFFGILFSIIIHLWFFCITVQCAKKFRIQNINK